LTFQDCNVIKPILKALAEQGYTQPTAIQAGAIRPASEGRDILGTARTGTGKTCAFAVPILQRLNGRRPAGCPIRALVLTPTRELAIQNGECFQAYGKYLSLKTAVIFGGVGQGPQVDALQKGVDILVATPGRLCDLYQQGLLDLSHLEIFVLDEADRMLDMGFIHDVRKILKWLPERKQTLFFSATMPKELTELVDSLLHDPVHISVDPVNTTVDAIEQSVYKVDKANKTKLLVQLLRENDWPAVLVFTRTKHGANKVAQDLEKVGIHAAAIHGNKSQTARQAALAGFKQGEIRVLVATDLAARGLDIEDLGCVVNYNLPEVPETYVHRIGRTGRAGKGGVALSFCTFDEQELLRDIEKLTRKQVPVVADHPFPMEQTQPAKRDQKGRIINEEDQEAREAARALAKERREAQRRQQAEAAEAKTREETPAAEEQKASKSSRRRKKKKSAAEGEATQTVSVTLTPEEEAPAPQSKEEKSKKRPKKAARPEASVSELFGVDIPDLLPPREEEPVSVAEERFDSNDILHRKPKRPERRVVPSLSSVSLLPEIELKETFGPKLREDSAGLSGSAVTDATERMFQTKATLPTKQKPGKEEPSPAKSARKAKGSKQTAAAPVSDEARPPKAEKQKKKQKGEAQAAAPGQTKQKKTKKTGAADAQQTPKGEKNPQKKGQTKEGGEKKGKRSKGFRPGQPVMRPSRIKDSTEQESLMKPYYLSDLGGKRK
jgi:ATP-dependent RNA helicase RhlE